MPTTSCTWRVARCEAGSGATLGETLYTVTMIRNVTNTTAENRARLVAIPYLPRSMIPPFRALPTHDAVQANVLARAFLWLVLGGAA